MITISIGTLISSCLISFGLGFLFVDILEWLLNKKYSADEYSCYGYWLRQVPVLNSLGTKTYYKIYIGKKGQEFEFMQNGFKKIRTKRAKRKFILAYIGYREWFEKEMKTDRPKNEAKVEVME